MDQQADAIRSDILKSCWYMRGGITYSEALMLSPNERQAINEIIKENLETTKKTGIAFF